MPEISQAWLALIGAILGGSGLKFIEHYLTRPKIKDDTAAAFRNELRQEMITLRAELKSAETDLDMWRDKYYVILEQLSKARIDRDEALHKVQESADQQMYSDTPQQDKGAIQNDANIARRELRNKERIEDARRDGIGGTGAV